MNPIIILGMAHTGTTALAKYIGSGKHFVNYTNGREAYLMECDELLYRRQNDLVVLQKLVEESGAKRYVFKRPWMEEHWGWFADYFPEAIYFVMYRPFPDVQRSWRKPESLAERGLNTASIESAYLTFDYYWRHAAALVTNLKNAQFLDYQLFARRPRVVDHLLCERYGITDEFDTSVVRKALG